MHRSAWVAQFRPANGERQEGNQIQALSPRNLVLKPERETPALQDARNGVGSRN